MKLRETRPLPRPIWRGMITVLLLWSNGTAPYKEGLGAGLYAQLQSGNASYYAKSWTGRTTASGDTLHHDSMTCAHRSYPFGTLLRVTNLTNNRHVTVEVTDRGPYSRGRVVDLSWGAAKALGMLTAGVVPVTVERVGQITPPFKPDDDFGFIDKFEFELADIAPTGIKPVWQHEVQIDQQAVKHSMRNTARESAQDFHEKKSK